MLNEDRINPIKNALTIIRIKATEIKATRIKTTSIKAINGKVAQFVVAASLCLTVNGCSTLPNNPHINDSLVLNTKLAEIYDNESDEGTKSKTTATQTNDASATINNSDSNANSNADANNQIISDTDLNKALYEQSQSRPNLSGYYPIVTGASAYASRSILAGMSNKSIDVQYYIWHNDQSGQLLMQDLWEAAERGVIVRLLLDDFNNNAKLDQHLRRLATHPNVAVRLINPMTYRKFQTLNYVTSPKRINRRMHNKSMTFDRQLSIIGGRNIGNEYLSNDKTSQFADLDVLLIGNVVNEITQSFEDYWNSPLSYDIETLVDIKANKKGFIEHLNKIDASTDSDSFDTDDTIYQQAIAQSTIDADLMSKQLPFRWAPITFLSDEVGKLNKSADKDSHLVYRLRDMLGTPTKKLTIISSYFVPTKDGVDTLVKLANQGVEIKILTNSFKATDVAAVHAGYAEWRVPLLKAGIALYELKAIASEEERENKLWRARSQSSTSLHAKAFAVDDHNFFIGSYNVDPRSANINTEMGVIINDEDPVSYLHDAVSDDLLNIAYKVVLNDKGALQWQTLEENQLVTYNKEPDVDLTDTIWLKIMSHLPIDWLL